MNARILVAMAGVVLSVVSRPARAETTGLTYTYGGPFNLRIPADPDASKGWMQDAGIMVPDHLVIQDLNVSLDITHTAAFDLRLFLKGPSGKTVTLAEADPFTGYYAGADYHATTFDDEASTAIADGAPPFAGSYRPLEPLTAFDGRDAYGLWRLQVYDAYYDDTGWLNSVTLFITASAPEAAVPVPTAGGLVLLGLGLIGPRLRRPGD